MSDQVHVTQPAQAVAAGTVWEAVDTAPVVTAAMAEQALDEMEAGRSRYTTEHQPAAARIVTLGTELGRVDLHLRAELILTDIDSRLGAPLEDVAKRFGQIRAQGEAAGEPHVVARSNFLLASIQYGLGDQAAARIHAIRGVELLTDHTPRGVLIDHLMLLALVSSSRAEADRCFSRALDEAAGTGDVHNAIRIHNTMAFAACRVNDPATATEHVEQMLRLSELRGVPLRAAPTETVARTHLLNHRYRESIAVLQPVLDDAENMLTTGDGGVLYTGPYVLPECLLTVAQAHRLLGEYTAAQQRIDQARVVIDRYGLRPLGLRALEEQAQLYADMGEFERAYEQHIRFHDAVAALQSDEQEARARLIQASFDAVEMQRDEEQFRELAMRDALTGLYNRRHLDEQLTVLAGAAARTGTALSVAIADADFFKRINDQLSHEVGDQVLRVLASIFASTVRKPGIVGRLGGEEFLILLPGVGADDAVVRCDEIRRAVADHDFSPMTGSLPVTVSIGVASSGGAHLTPSELLADADRNLYAAKRSGRNRVMADAVVDAATAPAG